MSLASLIKQELAVLRERYILATDETLQDPVFEGIIRDFHAFHECLGTIQMRAKRLVRQIEAFCGNLNELSDTVLTQYRKTIHEDEKIISDCSKFRESSNQITRSDAPHSCMAKLKRDMAYNVLGPVKSHLDRCLQLRHSIDLRNRRLAELTAAERSNSPEVSSCKSEFDATDRELFEWLMIIREFKGDILDSLLQTLKYLEYEFFASSAHAIANCLPERMEFRPMVEMTPKQLEIELKKDRAKMGYESSSYSGDYSKRLAASLDVSSPGEDNSEAVEADVLSLSLLLAQGFEEGPARRALRRCNNVTQAAMEFLLKPAEKPTTDQVRMPSTLHRITRTRRPLETPDLITFDDE
jgi:hypothetical protein